MDTGVALGGKVLSFFHNQAHGDDAVKGLCISYIMPPAAQMHEAGLCDPEGGAQGIR